jgi:hypothetical protein
MRLKGRLMRRVVTTTLTREVWVVRRAAGESAPQAPAWCADCAGPSGMLTPEEAAAVAGVSPLIIHEWAGAARLHAVETADGSLLICLNSLRA